jgi:hypothetical protein
MHFFIDQGELTVQQPVDAFGPDSGNPSNLYNVTSRFQLVNQAKVFACEAGMMIVQQSAVDPTLVNLIIKPNANPNALADVAYYVYRGVLKNSLIVGSLLQNTGADNELLTRIRANDPTAIGCGILGYDQGIIGDTETIESMFDNIRVLTPVFVKEGEWIGTFGTGFKIGFEVLLNTQRFTVTFGYVRAERYQVEVAGLAGMALRIKREEILNFVDPVAFSGLHFDKKVGYSEYNPNKVTKQTTTVVGTAGFIYTKLLDKFFTRNRVYLDIRSEKGYSYNFYQNYGEAGTNHNIDIANQSVPGVPQVYETSGWPILSSDANQATGANTNNLKIKLRIDDNTMPLIFIKNKFFKDTNPKSSLIKEDEISINGANTLTTWSKRIQFNFRNTGVGAPRPNIANYIKLNYFRQKHNSASPPNVLLNEKYYDSAFCSIDLPRLGDAAAFHKTAHSAEPIHVREPNNTDGTGNFGLNISNGVFWDSNRVLFYGMFQYEYPGKTSEKEYVNTYNQKLSLANTEYAASNAFGKTEILCRSYAVGSGTIRIPSINLFRGTGVGATKNHKENALFLGLTVAQVASLKADNQLSRLHNRFIDLRADPANPRTAAGGHRYFRYTVQLQGMLNDANPTRVTPLHGGNPIAVYSRDNQFFSSEAFSSAEPVTAGQNQIEFHIFHDGCVKITDNKDLALVHDLESVHYVYFTAARLRHDVDDMDIVMINKMGNGATVTTVPAGHTSTIDYTPYGVAAKTSYIYPSGDVITNGTKLGNPNYKIKYKNTGKKTFVVHLQAINYAALSVDFTYSATRRFYCRPEVAAAFIGTLVDVGTFVDNPVSNVAFDVVSTGSGFQDGTSFPSVAHNNGNAIDTSYQNAVAGLTNAQRLARDQKIVDGMHRHGAKQILRGTGTHYSTALTTATDGGTLHNTHLHSGNVTLNDCNRNL